MDKKTMQMVAVGAIILVVGVVIGSYFGSSPKTESPTATSTDAVGTVTPTAPAAPAGTAPSVTPSAPKTSTTLTRNEAYKYYSGKNLYTSLQDCVGFPMNFTFRVGTKMMVENASTITANMVFWDKTYAIPGKSFQIITVDHAGVYEAMCNSKISLKLQVSPQ